MKRNNPSREKHRVLIVMLLLVTAFFGGSFAADLAAQLTQPQFKFEARGRTYTVTVTSLPGSGFQFPNHWLYSPSGILPSDQTGGQYYVLFSSNQIVSGQQFGHEAVYLVSSPTGYDQFTAPTAILDLSTVSNICDIATARPIWDGSLWHVYVQGIVWQNGGCNPPGYIFEATGPALQWGSLQWVKTQGTNNALPIFTSSSLSGNGIAQEHQWFYTAPYTGDRSNPFLGIFNDWNFKTPDLTYCPTCASGNGTPIFGFRSADGIHNQSFWYYTSPATGRSTDNPLFILNPDVFLGGSADEATLGDPAITMGSADPRNAGQGVGFWGSTTLAPSPGGTVSPVSGSYPNLAVGADPSSYPGYSNFVVGTYPSSYPGTIDDPRFARNVYGYLDSVPNSSPKTWQSYIYYGITTYGTYGFLKLPSAFGVSQVTITEQGPAPVGYPVSVSKTGPGSGTVTSIPEGINCGTTCSANFPSGTRVTLTALAGANSAFRGWSGSCSGLVRTCSVTLDAAQSVTATFSSKPPYYCYSNSYPWYMYGYQNRFCSREYHPTSCYTSDWQPTSCD